MSATKEQTPGRSEQNPEPVYELTLEITPSSEAALAAAIEYVEDRLLGQMPPILAEISHAATRCLWAGYADDGIPVRLIPAVAPGTDQEQIDTEPAADERATYEQRQMQEIADWEQSPQGVAELAQQDRYGAFVSGRRPETDRLYGLWLDQQAKQFNEARIAWQKNRYDTLRNEFDALEKQRTRP